MTTSGRRRWRGPRRPLLPLLVAATATIVIGAAAAPSTVPAARSFVPAFAARGAALAVVGPRRPPPGAGAPPVVLASRPPSSSGEGGGGTAPDEEDATEDRRGDNRLFYDDFDDAGPLARPPPPPAPSRPTLPGGAASSSASSSPPSSPSSGDDAEFLASLRSRRSLLRGSSRELLGRWTSGAATSRAAFTINESLYNARREDGGFEKGGGEDDDDGAAPASFDWVRRWAVGSYPRVVCGGASGGVYVADVEAGRLLASAPNAHPPASGDDDLLEEDDGLLRYLYGDYDGGGVLAVAMTSLVAGGGTYADLVASAGREGGIKLHRWVRGGTTTTARRGTIDELEFVCSIPTGDGGDDDDDRTVVTCLKFDSLGRRLFAGGGDGRLRVVTFDGDISDVEKSIRTTLIPTRTSSSSRTSSSFLWRLKQGNTPPPSNLSPILSLDMTEALGMVATAHANGNVQVYSHDSDNDDGSDAFPLLGVWNPFADTNDACHARSVAFVSGGGGRGDDDDEEEDVDPSWSIVVGGGNGQMWVQEIHNKRIDAVTGTQRTLDAINGDDEDVRRMPTATTASAMPSSFFTENTMQQIKPSHRGPVVALSSRSGGILVSAGHDGMLRVSRICKPVPKALYGLGGYKVWIGSICIDDEGKRLLSDGRDDVVVVHDFSKDDEG